MEHRKLDKYRGCFIHETQRIFKCTGINLKPEFLKVDHLIYPPRGLDCKPSIHETEVIDCWECE